MKPTATRKPTRTAKLLRTIKIVIMYFWKVNSLVDDLKHGRVSQRQKMLYYLANTLFMLACSNIIQLSASKPNIFTLLSIFVGFLVTVFGISLCYKTNESGDDIEFVDRMNCLGWPVTVRMLAVLIPVYIAYGFFLSNSNATSETHLIDVLIMAFYSVYFYKWLHSCLLRISKQS